MGLMPCFCKGSSTGIAETRMILVAGGKASSPMYVTLLGILTDFSELHPRNASSSMRVTLSGIRIAVSASQFKNASYPMLVTPSEF